MNEADTRLTRQLALVQKPYEFRRGIARIGGQTKQERLRMAFLTDLSPQQMTRSFAVGRFPFCKVAQSHLAGIGTKRSLRCSRRMSAVRGGAENICSARLFRLLTQNRHRARCNDASGLSKSFRPALISDRLIVDCSSSSYGRLMQWPSCTLSTSM